MAARSGHESIARLLLEADANSNLSDTDGMTALLLASKTGRLEVVRLLLASGADKDLAKSDGKTALMLSSQTGHLEVVRLSGADKDLAKKTTGGTALMIASCRGHVDVVRLLLESAADKDLARNDCETRQPLCWHLQTAMLKSHVCC